MKILKCKNCGSSEFIKDKGYRVCAYCRSRFMLTEEDIPIKTSDISLKKDIERLLLKCKKEPRKARRYANLILDIDPGNKEARKYL